MVEKNINFYITGFRLHLSSANIYEIWEKILKSQLQKIIFISLYEL